MSSPSAGRDRLSDLAAFGPNPGGLRARTYVPADLPAQAALVVVLHGCTQTAAGYDHGSGWSQLADEAGFALLFPEQQTANNPNRCFNWFVPEHVSRGRGEVESVRQMIAQMIADHGLDPARVYVTGLSAGGAMTMAMLASYPEIFAGGAVIAGLPFGTANSVNQAFQRMRGQESRTGDALAGLVREGSRHDGPWPTLSVWHGDADATVSPQNAQHIVGQWRALHGVAAAPDRTETLDGQSRRVWVDGAGREVIEEITIAGMGHGTPLATAGEGAYGNAGPYMLDAGISSTRHIARFWGLAKAAPETQAQPVPGRDIARRAPIAAERIGPIPSAESPPPHPAAARQEFIQSTIENALRAAGLMR
jgi:poly(hydroxyalkanoate) depolymerase family esterase